MAFDFFKREKHTDHNPGIYWTLTKRHFRVFFNNKVGVIFSLLVPMITLIIYIVFLRQLQVSAVDTALDDIFGKTLPTIGKQKAHLLADAWMLSGIVAVSCITVSLNTCNICMIDKWNGVNKDFISSPISRRSVGISYLLFNILATFLINFCVLLVAFTYLGAVGGFKICVKNSILLIPTLLLSVISASLITWFISGFIRSFNTFNSVVVIISSATGFLIGTYMPISMLPGPAQKLPVFFPGTYSAGLLRTLFLTDYFNDFEKYLRDIGKSAEEIERVKNEVLEKFSLNINFFGKKVTPGYMVLAIVVFAIIFIALDYLFIDYNFRDFLSTKKKKRR